MEKGFTYRDRRDTEIVAFVVGMLYQGCVAHNGELPEIGGLVNEAELIFEEVKRRAGKKANEGVHG